MYLNVDYVRLVQHAACTSSVVCIFKLCLRALRAS